MGQISVWSYWLENKGWDFSTYDRSIVCWTSKIFSKLKFKISGPGKDAGVRRWARRRRGLQETSPGPGSSRGGAGGQARGWGRRAGGGARSAGTRQTSSTPGSSSPSTGAAPRSSWRSAPPRWSWWTCPAARPTGAGCLTPLDTQVRRTYQLDNQSLE